MLTAIADLAEQIAADNAARHAADRARKLAWLKRDRASLETANATLSALPGYRRPTGPARRQRIRATLRTALADAERDGLIDANPATHVRMDPEPDHTPTLWTEPRIAQWQQTGRKPSPVMVWTPDHTATFLDATWEDRLHLLFHLIAHTGLRRGEALALRRSDLRLTEDTLAVTRQLTQGSNGFEFTKPKSHAATRPVTLDTSTHAMLIAEAEHRSARRGPAALDALGDSLIFASPENDPLNPGQV